MQAKLYVGNLPYSATEEDLRALFGEFGEIASIYVVTDRDTGRAKGFAFVEFTSEEAANKAIEALNGKDYGGRGLVVNIARPKEERPRDFNRGGGDRGGNRQNNSW